MFWTDDLNELFKPTLIPTDHMSVDDKLNAISRLIIFICLVLSLVLQDAKIIVLMFFLLILVIIVQKYDKGFKKEVDKFMDANSITVVDNNICVKPTRHNPYMNPNLLDINKESFGACSVNDVDTNALADKYFNESMFLNVDDIYNTTNSRRQFYTVPSTTIPNDQTTFANWLYNRGTSCKEGDGERCFNNVYNDLRLI